MLLLCCTALVVALLLRGAALSLLTLLLSTSIGSSVDSSVGTSLGPGVSTVVRCSVGSAVHSSASTSVDPSVSASVRPRVSTSVDPSVGPSVGITSRPRVTSLSACSKISIQNLLESFVRTYQFQLDRSGRSEHQFRSEHCLFQPEHCLFQPVRCQCQCSGHYLHDVRRHGSQGPWLQHTVGEVGHLAVTSSTRESLGSGEGLLRGTLEEISNARRWSSVELTYRLLSRLGRTVALHSANDTSLVADVGAHGLEIRAGRRHVGVDVGKHVGATVLVDEIDVVRCSLALHRHELELVHHILESTASSEG